MNNFAVLNIAYSHTPTTILITITTNNPCHLTCYYTDKEPARHRTARNQRGLTLPWGAYYCFVAWLSVEQIEPGDTLTHTFEVTPWQYCQTKWFAFRGTVAATLSPSVSCLFEHHHRGLGPALKEQQLFFDTRQETGWASFNAMGQHTAIKNRLVTKLGGWLSKKGTGGWETLYFRIYRYSDKELLISKAWGLTSDLPLLPAPLEVTFDDPIFLNEDVIIMAWVPTGGSINNCAYVHYQHSDVKPDEYMVNYAAGWVEHPEYDWAYTYTYHQP
ncbi:hypothetical protein ES708_28464 [subsurface metagenome]